MDQISNSRPSEMPDIASPLSLPLCERLSRAGDVSSEDCAAFISHASPPKRYNKMEFVVQEGQRSGVLSLLCEGVAVSSRTLATGQQQHLAIFVPGDILNDEEFLLKTSGASVWALTPITTVGIAFSALASTIEERPGVGRALWRDMAAGARVMQEWMVSMGRRSAYQRVAHFLCEVQVRFRAAGLATDQECPFPLTQSELADTLGLSVVHINRVLQQLRREDLLQLSQSKLMIRDWSGLVRVGDFDPTYLNLPNAG